MRVAKAMRIKVNCRAGFTLVEIMTVVALIGLLAALAIPNSFKARNRAQRSTCISNLRQIDAAKQEWAVEAKQKEGAPCTDADVAPYIKGLKMPECPAGAGNTYLVNDVGTAPECRIDPENHVLP